MSEFRFKVPGLRGAKLLYRPTLILHISPCNPLTQSHSAWSISSLFLLSAWIAKEVRHRSGEWLAFAIEGERFLDFVRPNLVA